MKVSSRKFSFQVDGLRLAAQLYMPDGKGPYPALCLCHGVPAGTAPDPADRGYPGLAEEFAGQGFAALIFNFRGAGESEGNFDMSGWVRDLEGAITCLSDIEETDRNRLSVMGFSGGAAATAYCAAHDDRIKAVALCACPARFFDIHDFSRIDEFLQHSREIKIIRDAGFPGSIDEWAKGFEEVSALKWVDRISPRPLLIVHGENDETVPPHHARQLFEKALEPKEIVMVKGAGHRLRLEPAAMAAALSWLKRVNGLQ